MSEPDQRQAGTGRVIIIGASRFADASGAISLARLLARQLDADLRGIFVEEDHTLALALMPGARIVTSRGLFVLPPTPERWRAILAGDARAYEAALAAAARETLRRWTFERMRGDILTHLRRIAGAGDIALVGHGPFYRHGGPVVLIVRPGDGDPLAQDLAEALARDLAVPLVRVTVADAGDADSDPAALPVPDLIARIARTSASAVVADVRGGPLALDRDLREVVEAARCPVVLIGAGTDGRAIAHSVQIPPA